MNGNNITGCISRPVSSAAFMCKWWTFMQLDVYIFKNKLGAVTIYLFGFLVCSCLSCIIIIVFAFIFFNSLYLSSYMNVLWNVFRYIHMGGQKLLESLKIKECDRFPSRVSGYCNWDSIKLIKSCLSEKTTWHV